MSILLRPFRYDQTDVEAFIQIKNSIFPDKLETAARWMHLFASRPNHCLIGWNAVEENGRMIAVGGYSQQANIYHPQKFTVELFVHPAYQQQGYGRRLYSETLATLQAHQPQTLYANIRETAQPALDWAVRLGFREVMRTWESTVDPRTIPLANYAWTTAKMVEHGVTIVPFDSLPISEDRDRAMFDLYTAINRDIPYFAPRGQDDYQTWRQRRLNTPTYIEGASWVAMHEGRMVGYSAFSQSMAVPTELYQGLTGVRRDWRRKGIATALKVRGIEWAIAHNYTKIRTFNASNNEPMLAINIEMGFRRQPALIDFQKDLDPA